MSLHIAYLTAGAAGMYCGSCLHDNALAKALRQLGHDAVLIPTYTPILTDEENVSSDRLFFGGLNVYLQQLAPWMKWMPNWMDGFLSSPRLVQWIASRSMGTTADKLGPLTVSMLKGEDGRQSKEVHRLCDWLAQQGPDVVVFSNLLIAGCIPAIERRLHCPTVVVLQGDDIFYESLDDKHRELALAELRRLAKYVDAFIVHSQDYGDRMRELLHFDASKLSVVPLSINVDDFAGLRPLDQSKLPAVGYLARIAPEKGLHLLVDAFVELATRDTEVRLEIAGWLGPQNEAYWEEQQNKLNAAGLQDRFCYHGSVDREGKLEFLQTIDVLSVPTTYQEPKGLFVLESLAAGVPYVQPAHGAFPELHQRLGGGHLVPPNSSTELAAKLGDVLSDRNGLRALGQTGRDAVQTLGSNAAEAQRFAEILQAVCDSHQQS